MTEDRELLYRETLRQMQQQNWHLAASTCDRLTREHRNFAPGWIAASVIAQQQGRPVDALVHAERAAALAPSDASALLRHAQCLEGLRRRSEALQVAETAGRLSIGQPRALEALGTFYSSAGDIPRALEAYDRACEAAPRDARLHFGRAALRRFLGDLSGAEHDYDRVLELDPRCYEAYLNRSNLRTQSPASHHLIELEAMLARGDGGDRGEVQLRYALAKENADLGRHEESWKHLERGARLKRRSLDYDLGVDLATVDWLSDAFPRSPGEHAAGAATDSPIFVVGLPRTGTTLVDRILSSHSQVESAGELRHFTHAMAAATRKATGRDHPSAREVIESSVRFDFAELGRDYLARCMRGSGPRFVDKMPINYLYCGLIHRALPQAKIVHVTRGPLATCYAMYKTLFADGYPYSYDLEELAACYIAYRRLMNHWRRTMPDVLHEISYEALVADAVGESRRLLDYCDLEWEEACREFHRNPSASTTASAHQVRRPIYDTSVSEWRVHGQRLEGLRARLESAGLTVEPRQ